MEVVDPVAMSNDVKPADTDTTAPASPSKANTQRRSPTKSKSSSSTPVRPSKSAASSRSSSPGPPASSSSTSNSNSNSSDGSSTTSSWKTKLFKSHTRSQSDGAVKVKDPNGGSVRGGSNPPGSTPPSPTAAAAHAERNNSGGGSLGSKTYNRLKGGFDGWREKQRNVSELRRSEHLRMKLPRDVYADLTRIVYDFIKEFEEICKQPTVTVETMSQAVLRIYEDADDRITNEPLWQTVDDATAEAVADGFQKHIMTTIYELVFSANEADEAKDLNLQERIREFRWVEPSHLDAVCDLTNEEVVEEFYKAQEKLIIMDAQRPPQDKLACVVEASKAIFGILEKSSGGTNSAAADDYLPVLIYVVLQANPPMLYSNLQYLERFCDPNKLMSGETGYYFTNLYSAVSFIETLDATSLKIGEGEFQKKIHGANAYKISNRMGNHGKLKGFLDRLKTLSERQEHLTGGIKRLEDELDRIAAGGPPVKGRERSRSVLGTAAATAADQSASATAADAPAPAPAQQTRSDRDVEAVLTADDAAGSHHYMAMNNRKPIATHMQKLVQLDSPDAIGLALEIGSGTGAQLELLAETYKDLMWRPSEYSVDQSVVRGFYEQGPDGPLPGYPVAKVRTLGDLDDIGNKFSNVLPAVELDGSAAFDMWPAVVTNDKGKYALVFASNIVHIAPWAVAEGIFAGAAACLRVGGSLVYHGPFIDDGKFQTPDTSLFNSQMRNFRVEEGEKRVDKGWGVRDVKEMVAEAAKCGLRHAATVKEVGPAKNFLLQFVKE